MTAGIAKKTRRQEDRLLNNVERGLMRQMRRLKRQAAILKRKQERAVKQLEREAYGWASLGS
jgi:hypothetical protein